MILSIAFLLKVIILLVLLAFSAFFSASETALFSLDSIKIKRLNQDGRGSSKVVKLLENPLRCLTTILAGNTLVDIALSTILTAILIDIFGPGGVTISIIITTFIILAFGEVTPKTIAIYNNERLSILFAPVLYFFGRIITPFLFLATNICDNIISFFKLNLKKEPTLTEEEFRTVMEVGHRHGVVGKSEKEMVVSILEFTTTTTQEVMTPRTDIKAVSSQWQQDKVLDYARGAKHSKVPVYRDSFDNILGFIQAKDIFLQPERPFVEFLSPIMFVPETKKISELIREFYRQKTRIAIVVDEYGGTSGIITLQDILEEIFGEIYDEYKIREILVEDLSHGKYRISGKASVYKVNEDCGLKIPPGDYETIAGFLLDILGKIPPEGELVRTAGAIFTIEKIVGRRIQSVVMERL